MCIISFFIDPKTLRCINVCYSYFISPEELIVLLYNRIIMNNSPPSKIKKEIRRVEEIIRNR